MKVVVAVLIVVIAVAIIKFLKRGRIVGSGKLSEDIPAAASWLVLYFEGMDVKLDYSVDSVKAIDLFLDDNLDGSKPKAKGKLSDKYGYKLFAISSYVAEVFLKNTEGSDLETDDTDSSGELNFSVKFKNGGVVWPAQKLMKRIANGREDALSGYVKVIIENYAK